MQGPRLYNPDESCESETPETPQTPADPGEVLGLVHQLEAQAARSSSPEVRTRLLKAGCELLEAALNQLKLPAAA